MSTESAKVAIAEVPASTAPSLVSTLLASNSPYFELAAACVIHRLDAADLSPDATFWPEALEDRVDRDPRCLDLHDNPGYTCTASYAQVTEKLYSRSRYRYTTYLLYLEPVLPMLEPVVKRLGYTIESA